MAKGNEYWARVSGCPALPTTLFRFNREAAREEIWRVIAERWDPYRFGGDMLEGRLEPLTIEQVKRYFPAALAA